MDNINCPLCCQKSFRSKETLIAHLSVLQTISCPLCQDSFSSINNLLEHLSVNNCELNGPESIVFIKDGLELDYKKNLENTNNEVQMSNVGDQIEISFDQFKSDNGAENCDDVSKMYVELLRNQLMKPCLESRDLKFVHEDGENRYMVVQQENLDSTTVVTKQNSDGTISILTEKDLKSESVQSVTPPENILSEDKEGPTYSCNSCGVTFTSVLEHIQNYHNGQDVVVEEPIESSNNESLIAYLPLNDGDESASNKQSSRRMITDTGDIVDTPVSDRNGVQQSDTEVNETGPVNHTNKSPKDKHRRSNAVPNKQTNSKKVLKVEKVNDNVATDCKNDTKPSNVPYHKVIMKELLTVTENAERKKMKVYNCISCNIYVSNLDDFKEHPCKTAYTCPYCMLVYDNQKSLAAHMKKHKNNSSTASNTQETEGEFRCEVCTTVFPTNKSLKLHKRMHDPIKSRPLQLPVQTHTTDLSDDDRWFVCPTCDKLIPVDYRTVHQESHRIDNTFNCEICNRKFQNGEYLLMHMKVHNIDKAPVKNLDKSLPYNCLYCDRQFARPHEKVKHERIHTGEKPHSCEICGKSFRVSYCLTLHMRTHTGARPYACQHCPKRFKAHSVYNHHLLTHSEVRAYKCPYCPKAFKTSVQLAGHKNSHTKPFSCQHCNRPFASLYAVRVHTETHLRQNNLKYSCVMCGASYARTFALKDHMKQAHNKELDSVPDHSPLPLPVEEPAAIKEEMWLLSETNDDDENLKAMSKEINDLGMAAMSSTTESEALMMDP